MKQFTFTSQLAPIIWKYLESRQNEGYTSVHCGYYMQELDCLSKELSDAPVVTKELIDAWDLLKPYLSNRSKIVRHNAIRAFAKFAYTQDGISYVPDTSKLKNSSTFTPHIFTVEEIRRLLYAADNLPVRNNAPTRHLVIPAVIRLLYCCGFRIGEVLRLRVKDVDLDTGIITVHNGKGGKAPTTKMKEVKSMAKKIGIIVLLCFSLCVGGVSAFANEGHDETDTQTLIETQPPVSSVLFRQDGADIQQSTDEGKTWQSYSPIEETDYFTYDEFSAWIENETENIQKLVDAGEWTEAEATEALEYYDEILKSILEGKMVGKRASSSDDQLFFSMPDNAQPEQYQTFVFDGNTYKSIGPFDTEEELFNALKEYTDTEVEAGTMSQAEATALLEKYQ